MISARSPIDFTSVLSRLCSADHENSSHWFLLLDLNSNKLIFLVLSKFSHFFLFSYRFWFSLLSSPSANNKQRLQSPCRPGPSWQLASRGDLNPLLLSVNWSILIEFNYSRYFAICQPLTSRRWQTLKHAYKLICVIWSSSLLFMSPIAVLSELIPTRDGESEMLCNFTTQIILSSKIYLVFLSFLPAHIISKNTPNGREGRKKCRDVWPNEPIEYEKMFTIFLDLFLLVVPLIVLTAAYFLISRTLWRSMDEEKIYIEQMPGMKCVKFYAESCSFFW